MNYRRFLGAASAALMIVIVITLVLAPGAWAAGKYKTLYAFSGGTDGWGPADLILGANGNLYGNTNEGGASIYCPFGGCGTVFKLAPNADGSWTESILYNFCSLANCADGTSPMGGLIFDQAGNLYGTTSWGGDGHGTVYKLAPNPDGTWAESVLYSFTGGSDGTGGPYAGLIFDQAGNLYGTNIGGDGSNCFGSSCGNVFKLAPNPDGSWTESVLHTFEGTDGGDPWGALVLDQAGNLYGTTAAGGDVRNGGCEAGDGCGVIFELTPNPDGSWTEKVLHTFRNGNDGGDPIGALVLDRTGNLYGTALQGGGVGCVRGCGVVFKLTPNARGGWTEKALHRFAGGKDGGYPQAGLIFDQAGNLYGTTEWGGDVTGCSGRGCGVVFKLVPNSNGGWKETVLRRFVDSPGAYPCAAPIFDAVGNLYGTTEGDGGKTFGSVFEVTP